MAHFAKLNENNIVVEVHTVSNDALDASNEEESGIVFLTEWSGGYSNWKQTSYNANFRKQYCGVGYLYDAVNDVFIAPSPYPSWVLDNNFDWKAPIPTPTEEVKRYAWDEATLAWVEVE